MEMISLSYDVNDYFNPNQNMHNFVVSEYSKPISV